MSWLRDHVALLAAIASIVAWWAALAVVNPHIIADERIHFGVVQEILHGEALSIHLIPMKPAYHYLIAAPLALLGDSLLAARAVNAAIAIGGVILLHVVTSGRPRGERSAQVLLLAWNPILMPLCALVYTEGASTVAIVAALAAQQRRRRGLAALALLVACLMRQSNVLWVVFAAAWDILQSAPKDAGFRSWLRDMRRPAMISHTLRRLWPYLLLIAAGVAFFFLMGGPTFGPAHDNRAKFNPAQLYLFGTVVLVVWLPVWCSVFAQRLGDRILAWLRWGVVCGGLLAAIGFVEMHYVNPHPWNGDPSYLRNWFLVSMHRHMPLRLAVSAAIVAMLPLILWHTLRQPARRDLGLAWAFSILFLLPHWLAEMRYYIVPLVLLNFLTRYSGGSAAVLVLWNLLISAAICAYVAVRGSVHGGLW